MPFDYYNAFAKALLVLHQEVPLRVLNEDVLAWLSDAPTRVDENAFGTWTTMLALYWSKMSDDEPIARKAEHLAAYFNALENISDDTAVRMFADSSLESFFWQLGSNPNALEPAVEMLLGSGWEPVRLLERMRHLGDAAACRRKIRHGRTDPFEQTAHGLLLNILHPYFRGAAQGLRPNPVYIDLLKTYALNSGFQPENDARFIRNVLRMCPHELHTILAYVQGNAWLQPAHIEAVFPLPLSTHNAVDVLRVLIQWLEETQGNVQDTTRLQLQRYHPEMVAMFQLHRELYPNMAQRLEASDALTEAFIGIVQRDTGIEVEALCIPEGLFEDTGASMPL